MFRDMTRYGKDPETVVRSSPQTFNRPLRWEREAAAEKRVDLVFACSWSDWFIKEADAWRDDAWAIVRKTPHLTYQILTKRPNRIKSCLPKDWGAGYDNVLLGVTAEDQKTADARVPILLDIPAKGLFLSVEPMLGPVSLTKWFNAWKCPKCGEISPDRLEMANYCHSCAAMPVIPVHDKISWVIYGGESGGSGARPMNPEWVSAGLEECRAEGVRAFVKQMGSVWAREQGASHPHGADPMEWEPEFRVQEFPPTRIAVAA